MTAGLLEALTALQDAFPHAAALIAIPDTAPTTGHGRPGSRPPWNPQAAAAFYDPYQGIRWLHAAYHHEVTGRPLAHCAASARSTGAHIRAVAALAVNISPASAQEGARMAAGWVRRINQLPARDTEECPQRVTGAECFHCHVPMLRLLPKSGQVTCLRAGANACFDCDGNPSKGFIRRGLDGEPLVEWADGCLQYAVVHSELAAAT